MVEKLGIVYTPVPVVDFIINSANYALQQEFGVGIGSEGVHVLDPFTGTGTFMVRLLQSGLIPKADLPRKYAQELHANELVLLAYYIAAINIEETYHGLMAEDAYTPFEGIVLTDTFQLAEGEGRIEGVFPANSQRAEKQRKNDIRVIIGNPPYSAGQKSQNDNNKNLEYPYLDKRINDTYVEESTASLSRFVYDSYIRAIRWASDRIKDKGIICFVTNGSFMDGNAMDGVRKCLVEDFTSLYVFNLRGNQRTQGETSRQEGGKIFDGGSRATIAITLLIKNPEKAEKGQVFYHDIGDYLDRKTKLKMIEAFKSVENIPWKRLTPNSSHDWINQRDPAFDAFLALGDKSDKQAITLFDTYSLGISTNRDAWTYNFSKDTLISNMGRMIDFYNEEIDRYRSLTSRENINVDTFISQDSTKISWSDNLKKEILRQNELLLNKGASRVSLYRPYCKQNIYFDSVLNERQGKMPKIFPIPELDNLVICPTGVGANKDFSVLISNTIPDLEMISKAQCFPLYTYEEVKENEGKPSFDSPEFKKTTGYQRKDNISKEMLQTFQQAYADVTITKEAIFYYVYGILHSPEYKTRFEADLKKMLPRLPLTKETADFWTFSNVGKELAYWHLNYETVEPHPSVEEHQSVLQTGDVYDFYRVVEKMRFPQGQKIDDCPDTIVYNSRITLSGIPQEAWGYVVNGKPALGWIMERYAVKVHPESGIKNDPNLWCLEQENPRYIVDLIKRMVRVSVESVRLVGLLPPLNERVEG